MNPIVRQMVNQKIRNLTVKELIKLGRENNISLTVKQATAVLNILQDQPFDIGNKNIVLNVNNQLKQLDPALYKKARQLLKPYESYLDYSLD
ncbi:DUF2624 family protein [Evansella cellulosilytica]|uniref:DUF2624 domain-containing protein n=1 Tax=Evansella cellulosilytica (strain ATCC 21833 / DSM 2522 / FERM P-1141 / JCM 9156 / N-4) TaxID=649639 RepID=E6TWU0_EVAC2|nr:DUF2624 family protein [Evansella cellulosilytica]ADU29890.1 hypothetical protein Bcell_1627 [Evansella cellulosilytica DSM 2522]